jgi:hypothetical protein
MTTTAVRGKIRDSLYRLASETDRVRADSELTTCVEVRIMRGPR